MKPSRFDEPASKLRAEHECFTLALRHRLGKFLGRGQHTNQGSCTPNCRQMPREV